MLTESFTCIRTTDADMLMNIYALSVIRFVIAPAHTCDVISLEKKILILLLFYE